jgi:hypothetical protein
MVRHEVESISLAIEHAAQLALDKEQMSHIELARLLSHWRQTDKEQETA